MQRSEIERLGYVVVLDQHSDSTMTAVGYCEASWEMDLSADGETEEVALEALMEKVRVVREREEAERGAAARRGGGI